MVAKESLNDRYRLKILTSQGERKAYLLQDRSRNAPDAVCVHEGDLKGHPAIRDNRELLRNSSSLRISFFWPHGLERDFGDRGEYVAGDASVVPSSIGARRVLYLDQIFHCGGSGGFAEIIARRYMVIRGERASVTDDYHVITSFRIGYPRMYGMADWSKGSMEYSHGYGLRLSLQDNELVVELTRQRFWLGSLFDSQDDLKNRRQGELWGEHFRYDDFEFPRPPNREEGTERLRFRLRDL